MITNKLNRGGEGFVSFATAIAILCAVGLLYAVFIEAFWNGVVVEVVSAACKITYWKSYAVFLFFAVLPKIMPIRFNFKNNGKNDGK